MRRKKQAEQCDFIPALMWSRTERGMERASCFFAESSQKLGDRTVSSSKHQLRQCTGDNGGSFIGSGYGDVIGEYQCPDCEPRCSSHKSNSTLNQALTSSQTFVDPEQPSTAQQMGRKQNVNHALQPSRAWINSPPWNSSCRRSERPTRAATVSRSEVRPSFTSFARDVPCHTGQHRYAGTRAS